jgi:hypothetical protein
VETLENRPMKIFIDLNPCRSPTINKTLPALTFEMKEELHEIKGFNKICDDKISREENEETVNT